MSFLLGCNRPSSFIDSVTRGHNLFISGIWSAALPQSYPQYYPFLSIPSSTSLVSQGGKTVTQETRINIQCHCSWPRRSCSSQVIKNTFDSLKLVNANERKGWNGDDLNKFSPARQGDNVVSRRSPFSELISKQHQLSFTAKKEPFLSCTLSCRCSVIWPRIFFKRNHHPE